MGELLLRIVCLIQIGWPVEKIHWVFSSHSPWKIIHGRWSCGYFTWSYWFRYDTILWRRRKWVRRVLLFILFLGGLYIEGRSGRHALNVQCSHYCPAPAPYQDISVDLLEPFILKNVHCIAPASGTRSLVLRGFSPFYFGQTSIGNGLVPSVPVELVFNYFLDVAFEKRVRNRIDGWVDQVQQTVHAVVVQIRRFSFEPVNWDRQFVHVTDRKHCNCNSDYLHRRISFFSCWREVSCIVVETQLLHLYCRFARSFPNNVEDIPNCKPQDDHGASFKDGEVKVRKSYHTVLIFCRGQHGANEVKQEMRH